MAKRKRQPSGPDASPDAVDSNSTTTTTTMATAATTTAANSNGGSAKRARKFAGSNSWGAVGQQQQSVVHGGRVDPTYGQRSAIPGLDDYDDHYGGGGEEYEGREGGEGGGRREEAAETEEEGEWEEERERESDDDGYGVIDVEALSYLRSVREEASAIPTLLVAPRIVTAGSGEGEENGDDVDRAIYEDGVGDSRGWYKDGAYTAAPMTQPMPLSESAAGGEEDMGRDPQETYYTSLLAKFEALRGQLAQVPPRYAVERLGPDHGCHMSNSTQDYKMWRWRLGHTEAKPAQLAGMDKDTLLRLLRMMGDTRKGQLSLDNLLGQGGKEVMGRRLSAWVWGLLAKLPGRGELASEEVGVVRELGKRAVWVGVEMKGVDMRALKEQMGEGEEEGMANGGEDAIVDVEIDDEEERQLGPEASNDISPNQDKIRRQTQSHEPSGLELRDSTAFSDPPAFGPISPESLREQSSENLNSEGKHGHDPSQPLTSIARQQETSDEEALATARARLLARLGSPSSAQADHVVRTGQKSHTSAASATAATGAAEEEEQQEVEAGPQRELGKENEMQGNSDEYDVQQGAKVLLDMIITVVGEVYGQRDLLEFREVWA